MFTKEWEANFKGHQIVATNSWGNFGVGTSAKLYIDGECVDTNTDSFAFSAKRPLLRGCLVNDGRHHVVEVFAKSGLFRIPARICIDGQTVAGNRIK